MADTVSSITSRRVEYEIEDEFARETKLDRDELPKVVSAFENDAGYITKAVSDLVNYYSKEEVYTRDEIDLRLSTKWASQVVDSLPTENISESTIYFVRIPLGEQGDVSKGNDYYSEYIYVNGVWEMIGNTHVDLDNYYTKSEADKMAGDKVAAERDSRLAEEGKIKGSISDLEAEVEAEVVDRKVEDSAIRESVGNVQAGLAEEVSRATAAEAELALRAENAEQHALDRQNPHEVTAEQVGLGKVTNVATTGNLIEGSEENITSGAVYEALERKVDRQEGKGLSDENFSLEEKMKLESLENYDDTEIRGSVDGNKSAIETLNGDADVEGSVDNKIATALADVTSIKIEVVKELPEEGENGVIYFVPGSNALEESNEYDEYVWAGGAFEKLGSASSTVSLVDYYNKAQVDALVSVKADKGYVDTELGKKQDKIAMTEADVSDANYVVGASASGAVTKTLWSKVWEWIKGKIQTNILTRTIASDGDDGWLNFQHTGSSGDVMVVTAAVGTDNSNKISFGIGSGHNNRGIYVKDKSGSYWMIRTSDNTGTCAVEAPKGFLVNNNTQLKNIFQAIERYTGTLPTDINASSATEVQTPTAGALGNETNQSQFANRKTFLGTIQFNGTWYNVISVRHRNGTGDGNLWGMILRCPLTSAGSIEYSQQLNTGGWTAWKTVMNIGDILSDLTLNGPIKYYNGGNVYNAIQFATGNVNDCAITVGAGGRTVIGSGESYNTYNSNSGVSAGAEVMAVTSDEYVEILTNMQNGWGNRKRFLFGKDGIFTNELNNPSSWWLNKNPRGAFVHTGPGNASGWNPTLAWKTPTGKWEFGSLGDKAYLNFYADSRTANGIDKQYVFDSNGNLSVPGTISGTIKIPTSQPSSLENGMIWLA